MSDDSLTTRVLIEIREEIREMRRDTNARFDLVNTRTTRLESAIERFHVAVQGEFMELEVRQATRVTQQSAILLDLRAMFADRFELRDRVDRCEQAIADLQKART